MEWVSPFGRSTSPTDKCVRLAVLSSASSRLERASIKDVSSNRKNSLYSGSQPGIARLHC